MSSDFVLRWILNFLDLTLANSRNVLHTQNMAMVSSFTTVHYLRTCLLKIPLLIVSKWRKFFLFCSLGVQNDIHVPYGVFLSFTKVSIWLRSWMYRKMIMMLFPYCFSVLEWAELWKIDSRCDEIRFINHKDSFNKRASLMFEHKQCLMINIIASSHKKRTLTTYYP